MNNAEFAENLHVGTLCTAALEEAREGRSTRQKSGLVAGEYINRDMMCSIIDAIVGPEIKYIMTFGGQADGFFCNRFYLFDTATYKWRRARTYCPDLGINPDATNHAVVGIGHEFVVISDERVSDLDAMGLVTEAPMSVGMYSNIAKRDGMDIKYATLVAIPFNTSVLLMGVDLGGGKTGVASPRHNKWVVREIPAKHKIFGGAACTVINHECVLITGGLHPGWDLPSSHCVIYNARTHSFTPTGSMKRNRSAHAACLLLNGDVFVCGGRRTDDDDGYIQDGERHPLYPFAELYNHHTHTWSELPGKMRPRVAHKCTPISETRVLILGGWTSWYIHDKKDACEIYDLSNNAVGLIDEIPVGLHNFTVLPLFDTPSQKTIQQDVD